MKLEKINPFVEARRNAGYRSRDAFAEKIGVTKSTYKHWEMGVNATVYSNNLSGFKKMCDIFGWSYEEGLNNLSNLNKWRKDKNINVVKPTGTVELATLDTSNTDISKEQEMLDNPLKIWRGQKNLTRSEAAKLCHVDINVYSDCEDGVKKPNGFDLTKILKGTGLGFVDIQKIFRDDTVKNAIENALAAKSNNVISIQLCDEIDHNKIIEDIFEASRKTDEDLDEKSEAAKNAYPLNFIVGKCGLPAEDWIVEEFNRQMDEKVYASKDAASYIFFKPERDAIRKIFRDGRVADPGLLGNVDDAALIFKNHLEKLKGLVGTVAEKITEAKPTKIDEPKQDPIQKKLANQTVSYLKEENVLDDSSTPATNSKSIAISKQTARYILRTLYGTLDFNEYYKILSEFTKGGLKL
jgi:DNA-binding XRE family transcriptional regulator